jgi:hypothetical protein
MRYGMIPESRGQKPNDCARLSLGDCVARSDPDFQFAARTIVPDTQLPIGRIAYDNPERIPPLGWDRIFEEAISPTTKIWTFEPSSNCAAHTRLLRQADRARLQRMRDRSRASMQPAIAVGRSGAIRQDYLRHRSHPSAAAYSRYRCRPSLRLFCNTSPQFTHA